MIYDDLFIRLERARWQLSSDIPFDTIDPSLVNEQWRFDLRQICLTELSALYATEMFLRDFYTDIDFCSFVSIWFYEEMKHHMVLRKYLEQCGETFDEVTELPQLRLTFAEGPAIETYSPFPISMWTPESAWVSTSSVRNTFVTPSSFRSGGVPFSPMLSSFRDAGPRDRAC